MELMEKQEYKTSKQMLIPEDWKLASIGELCTIFGRIGFRGYTVNDIVKEDQGAITLSPSNIIDGQLNLSKVTYLSWFKYDESPEIKIYNGDILLVKTGSTFGKTALVKNLNEKATLNPQIVVLKKVKCDNAYLGYMMGYQIVQNQINSTVVGGAIPTLSQEQVSRFKIPLPPTIDEQKAIATALSDVDDLIANLDKLITKKKAIKQGAMQQLLTPPHKGGKRLDGFSGEWEFLTIESAADCLDNLRVPLNGEQRGKMNGDIPYCGANGVVDYVNDFVIDDDIILMAEDGGYFDEYKTRPIAYRMKGKCWVNNHAHILKAKNNTDQGFLYFSLVHKNILDYINGGTRAKLNKGEMNKIECWFPKSINEQEAISGILSDMDAELEQLETKKAKYQDIKQGMMQELLTGKTRLV